LIQNQTVITFQEDVGLCLKLLSVTQLTSIT